MPSSLGLFAGKLTFGSTVGGPMLYVTTWFPQYGSPGVPAMKATTATESERCTLYDHGDGAVRIQMGNQLWIDLNADLGWLMLTDDPAEAAILRLTGEPLGQVWEVMTPSGWCRVGYVVDSPSPLLTINGAFDSDCFAPTVITPSLDQIRAGGSGRGGDFQHVCLAGENLEGIDLTGADFRQADLTGVSFKGSTLTQAIFVQTAMTGVTCDGAVLDQADFTQADLTQTSWGKPASAKGLILTQCSAAGAVLGNASSALDCTGGNLSLADLRGADLRNLDLRGCQAGGALLAGAKLDEAHLDDANLCGAVLNDASLVGASLIGATGRGASFVRANLSNANLTRAEMGSVSYCFTLAGSFAGELDAYAFPQPDLIDAFAANGITLKPTAPIAVITAGSCWRIDDADGPYDLSTNAEGAIDVFCASPDLTPAVFRDAVCLATIGTGASFSGADLRGVQWHGAGATLDHADLQGASLSGAMLDCTDFTQAYLDGADLSGSVLIQAKFGGCHIGPGDHRRMFSLEGALLMGADFSDATLVSALLIDAAVGLPHGVPLFDLPKSAAKDLDAGNVSAVAPSFAKAGYPLGSNPSVTKVRSWLLDNHADTSNAPRSYWVQEASGKLKVYDGGTMGFLFSLPSADAALLDCANAPPELVQAFKQNGYSLSSDAPITPQPYWEIKAGVDAPFAGPYAFPIMRVFTDTAALPVFGSVGVVLRDGDPSSELFFGPTQALESALDASCMGPSGAPCAWVEQELTDWPSLMTVKR